MKYIEISHSAIQVTISSNKDIRFLFEHNLKR